MSLAMCTTLSRPALINHRLPNNLSTIATKKKKRTSVKNFARTLDRRNRIRESARTRSRSLECIYPWIPCERAARALAFDRRRHIRTRECSCLHRTLKRVGDSTFLSLWDRDKLPGFFRARATPAEHNSSRSWVYVRVCVCVCECIASRVKIPSSSTAYQRPYLCRRYRFNGRAKSNRDGAFA